MSKFTNDMKKDDFLKAAEEHGWIADSHEDALSDIYDYCASNETDSVEVLEKVMNLVISEEIWAYNKAEDVRTKITNTIMPAVKNKVLDIQLYNIIDDQLINPILDCESQEDLDQLQIQKYSKIKYGPSKAAPVQAAKENEEEVIQHANIIAEQDKAEDKDEEDDEEQAKNEGEEVVAPLRGR